MDKQNTWISNSISYCCFLSERVRETSFNFILSLWEGERNLIQFHSFLELYCLLIVSFSRERWHKDPIKQIPSLKQFLGVYSQASSPGQI